MGYGIGGSWLLMFWTEQYVCGYCPDAVYESAHRLMKVEEAS